jgi:hypothetical protein
MRITITEKEASLIKKWVLKEYWNPKIRKEYKETMKSLVRKIENGM